MSNTVILSFKASRSPLFKKALDAAKSIPTFHTSGDFFVVEFDFDEITRAKSKSFAEFERIYMMSKSWKDSRLRVLSNSSEDSYHVYKMILDRYIAVNPTLPECDLLERDRRAKEIGWKNPFEEGSDEWANWEIDNYIRRQKR